jgi:hypothetical protein
MAAQVITVTDGVADTTITLTALASIIAITGSFSGTRRLGLEVSDDGTNWAPLMQDSPNAGPATRAYRAQALGVTIPVGWRLRVVPLPVEAGFSARIAVE